MKHSNIILMASVVVSFMHCTKQAQKFTALVGATAKEVITDNVDSLVADSIKKENLLTSKIKIFDPNYDIDLVQYLEGEGQEVKVTYTFDEERRAGVVIDFHGEKRWLFRTAKSAESSTFSDDGIGWCLASTGKRATFVIKDKIYQLKVK